MRRLLRAAPASAAPRRPGASWPLGGERGTTSASPAGLGWACREHCPAEGAVRCPCPREDSHSPRARPRAPMHSCLPASEELGESPLLLPPPQPAPPRPRHRNGPSIPAGEGIPEPGIWGRLCSKSPGPGPSAGPGRDMQETGGPQVASGQQEGAGPSCLCPGKLASGAASAALAPPSPGRACLCGASVPSPGGTTRTSAHCPGPVPGVDVPQARTHRVGVLTTSEQTLDAANPLLTFSP